MSEVIISKWASGQTETALYAKIPIDIAEWLDKMSQLGIDKKDIVIYALRKVMATNVESLVLDLILPKAKALKLIEEIAEEKKAEKEVKA